MLETDSHNIFGSGGAATYGHRTVSYEKPTDGSLFFRREVLGSNEPTQYVMIEPAAAPAASNTEMESVDLAMQELNIPLQGARDIPEAAARLCLNAQLELTQQ